MDTWSESLSRSELSALYDIEITDREWENLIDVLDDAVAKAVHEILGNHDVR